MKTAQRILYTALALFNEQGESTVSSVDIANECEISPGNLYYHFRGKEQIVDGLMNLHRAQMDELLDSRRIQAISIDDMFYYFFLVIQKLHLFRFLYRSPADLMVKYPHFAAAQKRLLKSLESNVQQLFIQCHKDKLLDISYTTIDHIVQMTTLIITQSSQYEQLKNQSFDEASQYRGLSMLVTALLPRCTLSELVTQSLLRAIELQQLSSSSTEQKQKGGFV